MSGKQLNFLFLNIGHLFDHFLLLIFATVAALTLTGRWSISYAELIPYATPGIIAFGVCSIPAGWMADRWSREGMMVVFFIGLGGASIFTGLAQTPLQIGGGILLLGVFAAIYHPVGLALVVQGRQKTGVPLAINGVFGNLGVAVAALITGILIDIADWRMAFFAPGIFCILTGFAYAYFAFGTEAGKLAIKSPAASGPKKGSSSAVADKSIIIKIVAIMFISTAIGGVLYQAMAFALPKVFDERTTGSASLIGSYAFLVFAIAGAAQLVVGYFADRHSLRTVFAVVALFQLIFLALMRELAGLNAVLFATFAMMAVFGQIPINDVLVGRISTDEWRSRIFAFRYIITFTAMAVTLPLVSWVHANWGFTTLFTGLAAAAAATMISVLALPNTPAITGHGHR